MPKIFGQLEGAQVENLAADPTNKPVARSWFNTALNKLKVRFNSSDEIIATESWATSELDAHKASTSTHGVGEIVGRTETQTLTNKTLTAPVINSPTGITKSDVGLSNVDNTSDATKNTAVATLSNKTLASPVIQTPEVDILSLAHQTTPSNPSVGKNKVYVKADNKAYILDSNGAEKQLGSGGTGINFIEDGDASAGVTNYVKYADAGSRPVDGTGGAATIGFNTDNTNPISGTESFILSKGASNCQGQGVSRIFNIDLGNRAKVQHIEFDYMVSTGTFSVGAPGTDSDVIVYIYDVTNSTLIEPSSIKLLSNSTTLAERFSAYFQTSVTGSQYRLIFHVATTSTAAFSLKIDNISVSPSKYVHGTPLTDWQNFTYTITGEVTNPTQGAGATKNGYWRRVGDTMELRYEYIQTNAGSAGSGQYFWSIPSGYNIDYAKITQSGGATHAVGSVITFNGSILATGIAQVAPSNKIYGYIGEANTAVNVINSGLFPLSSATMRYGIKAAVPILGWSSSVQMSDSSDTRVVAANVSRVGTQSIPNSTTAIVALNTVIRDTHSAFNTSNNRYTAPVAGFYNLSGSITYATNSTGVRYVGYTVNGGTSVNLNQAMALSADNSIIPFSHGTFLNAGDYVEIVTAQTSGGTLNISSALLYVARESGPSAIAATETIAARYTSSSGQSVSNSTSTIVDYGTKDFDTHGAVTTGVSWKFTAPAAGIYWVSASVLFTTGGGWGVGESIYLNIFKNGSLYAASPDVIIQAAHGSYMGPHPIGTLIKMNAGDYIDLRVVQGSGATLGLLTSANYNYVSIQRIGL